MNSVLKVTFLLGCSAATSLCIAGGQAGVNHQGDGGVQEAIRFEKAKEAADARQAQIDAARRPHQGAHPISASERGNIPDSGVQAAIQFEKSKDAADSRQARIQAGQTNGLAAGSADRRVTGH